MRCFYCDYSPTTPSLSSPQEQNNITLYWDDDIQGWTCRDTCSLAEAMTITEEDELYDDAIEGETPLSSL